MTPDTNAHHHSTSKVYVLEHYADTGDPTPIGGDGLAVLKARTALYMEVDSD